MSRFVINEMIYDTDKMEHLGTVEKWYKDETLSNIFGGERGFTHKCEVYRSKKGNYLLTHKPNSYTTVGQAIEESEAKQLLMRYDYEGYRKIYGDLEDA